MLNIEKIYATDKALETEGVWHKLGGGIEICVARANNKKYKKVLSAKLSPFRQDMANGMMDNDILEEAILEAMSKTILVNWKGVTEDGVEIPYSVEKAAKFLSDYEDFRDKVSDISMDMSLYRKHKLGEAEKN